MAKRAKKARQALVKPGETAPPLDYGALVEAIGQAQQTAQRHAVQAINVTLTLRNWLIGYHIFEYEQHGSDRAKSWAASTQVTALISGPPKYTLPCCHANPCRWSTRRISR